MKRNNQVGDPAWVQNPNYNTVEKNENVLSSSVALVGLAVLFSTVAPFILSLTGVIKFDFALKSFTVTMFRLFTSVIKPLTFLTVKPNVARNILSMWFPY